MRDYRWKFDASRYSYAYLLSQVSEDRVQSSIMEMLSVKRIASTVVDAGGKKIRGGFIRAAKAAGVRNAGSLVAQGRGAAQAGLPDIVGCLPGGRALFIECKAPQWARIGRGGALRVLRSAGEPTEDQLAFLDTMEEAGALCMVAWSQDDVMDALREAGY